MAGTAVAAGATGLGRVVRHMVVDDPADPLAAAGPDVLVVLGAVAGATAYGEGALSDWGALHLREQLHAAFADIAPEVDRWLDERERTITTFGERLEPLGADAQLPWAELGSVDAVYFTAGDLDALRAARAARVLVANPRALDALGHGVSLDALVLSRSDAVEQRAAERSQGEAELVVITEGANGGSYRTRSGQSGRWGAVPPVGAPVDSYGCGDSFAAGLTYGLGAGMSVPDALALAARCGARGFPFCGSVCGLRSPRSRRRSVCSSSCPG